MEFIAGQMASHAGKKAYAGVSSQLGRAAGRGKYSHIQWENYNYPPCMKLIHYDLDEIEEPTRTYVQRLNISLVLTFFGCLLNLINNIVWCIMGIGGPRVVYSFFNILLFPPLGLYAFYKGFRSLIDLQDQRSYYKIGQWVLLVIWLLAAVTTMGSFNGALSLTALYDRSIISGVLGSIEVAINTLNLLLSIFNLHTMNKLD